MSEAAEAGQRRASAGLVFAGRYRIIEALGEGERKRTFLALDLYLERKVALAQIKPEAARSDPVGTKREVDCYCRAGSHDNIVTLYDYGTSEGTEYLVFEYLAGGTLRDYLETVSRQGRRLPVDDVLRLGRQIARALSQLHRQGLVHRAVAPANVWLDDRNVAHLGDLDSAVRRDDRPQDPKTLPSSTEAYASPEQIAGGAVDERSDLYSLGAVLYEAATGQHHLDGQGGRDIVAPSVLRPDLPPALNAIICRLLAESPDDRPASVDDLLAALMSAAARLSPGRETLAWADTLPFPLASILLAYDAELDAQVQVGHLLRFFEALAQFTVTVQLSAFRSDGGFFEANKSAWFGTRARPRLDLATFGAWMHLSRRLADTTRRLLSGENGGVDRCCELYRVRDPALVEMLISEELTRILQEALQYRNTWIGHGGVAGSQEHVRRLRLLERLLARTRDSLGTTFETWILLKPSLAAYTGGMFDTTVSCLMGTRSVFAKEHVRVEQPLDTSRLYLFHQGRRNALELVPLIRFIAAQSTGEEACYFYSRLQSNAVRWVSYHYQPTPELVRADPDVVEFLSDLEATVRTAG